MQATQVRVGMVIIYEGELCKVLSIHHLTQGNKRGKVQVEMRSVQNGNKLQYRYRSEDTVEKAVLSEKEMEYLYTDGDDFHFMDSATFEQSQIHRDDLGNAVNYLKPNTKVMVEFHEERPIGVELPTIMELTVVDTAPSMKGATASRSAKPATLDNGLTVKVPEFVLTGDKIRVDTSTNEYVERVG